MTAVGTLENSQKFNRVCNQRKLTWGAVVTHISRYALTTTKSEREAKDVVTNLKKELSRTKMPDKTLQKGLRIIGLSDDEIKNVLTPQVM